MQSHIAYVYEDPERFLTSVVRFLREGLDRRESLLVIARSDHLAALQARLALPPEAPCLWEDAEALADRIMPHGLDKERLEATLRELVGRAEALGGGRVRVYGELVAIMAERGGFDEAVRLEQLWNRLGRDLPFAILCGYSSRSLVQMPGEPVKAVLAEHSVVEGRTRDLALGGAWPAPGGRTVRERPPAPQP